MSNEELTAIETDVVVVGAGPGGYSAAFHAADLGLHTTLVDARQRPGGVCLNVGCIPSKALLHVAEVLHLARASASLGVDFGQPRIDVDRIAEWKNQVVDKLTGGLSQIAEMRGVQFVQGDASFEDSQTLKVSGKEPCRIHFKNAILATGSRPTQLPMTAKAGERILDSTSALELKEVYDKLLVIGGGYIGLELGSVYAALGSQVTVVEMTKGLLPGVDRDLVRPLEKRLRESFGAIHLETKVTSVKGEKKKITVQLEGAFDGSLQVDAVLVAVGRMPNTDGLGLENTSVRVEKGFVQTDATCRTNDSRIYAVGDVAGQPMLAHKAFREGKVAAEAIAGQPSEFDNLAIPAVVFTDPEIAWCGLTEDEARAQERAVEVARFPWAASGRALTLDRTDGLTKILFDPETQSVLGVGITGPGAGELIGEACLAIEMGAVAEDLIATIHAHPTLSETLMESAEVLVGHSSHIYRKKRH